jgi:hypothetical protein
MTAKSNRHTSPGSVACDKKLVAYRTENYRSSDIVILGTLLCVRLLLIAQCARSASTGCSWLGSVRAIVDLRTKPSNAQLVMPCKRSPYRWTPFGLMGWGGSPANFDRPGRACPRCCKAQKDLLLEIQKTQVSHSRLAQYPADPNN